MANLGGYVDPLALVGRGEPDEAERSVRRYVSPWSLDQFHLQHLTALMALTYVHLYRGEARAAYDAHLASWPAMKRNLIFHSQMTRIAMFELRARSALAVAVAGLDAEAAMRDAARQARSLERKRQSRTHPRWPYRFAQGLAALRGDGPVALENSGAGGGVFGDRHGPLRRGLPLSARAIPRRRGPGDGRGRPRWMNEHGIADPDCMAATFIPWPGGS